MADRHNFWTSVPAETDKSIPLTGLVRVVIPCGPWKLALNLKSVQISRHWICAEIDRSIHEQHFSLEDLNYIFRLRKPYSLQLEPEEADLPTPVVSSEVTAREVQDTCIQLKFDIISPPPDYYALLTDLSGKEKK